MRQQVTIAALVPVVLTLDVDYGRYGAEPDVGLRAGIELGEVVIAGVEHNLTPEEVEEFVTANQGLIVDRLEEQG